MCASTAQLGVSEVEHVFYDSVVIERSCQSDQHWVSQLPGVMVGMSLMQYTSWQKEPETWQYHITSAQELAV